MIGKSCIFATEPITHAMKVKISALRDKLGEHNTAYVLQKIGVANRKRNSVTLMQFIEKLPVMDWHYVLPFFQGNGKWFRLYLCQSTNEIKGALCVIDGGDKNFRKVHEAAIRYAYGKLGYSDLCSARLLSPHYEIARTKGMMYDLLHYDYTQEHHFDGAIRNLRIVLLLHLRHVKREEIIKAFKPFDMSALDTLDKIIYDMNDLFLLRAEEQMRNQMLYAATYLMNGLDPYPDL